MSGTSERGDRGQRRPTGGRPLARHPAHHLPHVPITSVEFAGLRLKNPVLVASGTFGYGREYAPDYDLSLLGGIMVKGLSPVPWPGNPGPRIAETPAGMLNAIGLQNPGVDHFLEVDLPWLRRFDTTVVANAIGKTVEEYVEVVERLDQAPGLAAIELNVSCPNIKEGGIQFGRTPEGAAEVVRAARRATRMPLLVKLSPNVADIVEMALAVEEAGADGLSLINTVVGCRIDVGRRRPALANVFGGLSGPAIRPIAVAAVYQVAQATRLPIIGMGGIETAEDALEFILAGATAVAVGTAVFSRPLAPLEVIEGIELYLRQNGVRTVTSLVGAAWKGAGR